MRGVEVKISGFYCDVSVVGGNRLFLVFGSWNLLEGGWLIFGRRELGIRRFYRGVSLDFR